MSNKRCICCRQKLPPLPIGEFVYTLFAVLVFRADSEKCYCLVRKDLVFPCYMFAPVLESHFEVILPIIYMETYHIFILGSSILKADFKLNYINPQT